MLRPLASDDPREMGPYALDGRLGASGSVYLGHTTDGDAVAVTMARGSDQAFRDRFARAVAAAGEHLRGSDPEATDPWLAVAYGTSLRQVVDDRGALPVAEVLALTAGIADALAALHGAGLVHGVLDADTVLADGPRLAGFGPDEGEPAADVRALGELIAHLAAGVAEPQADDVPEPLRTLARRCTANDPAARPEPEEIAEFCRTRPAGDPLAYVGTEPPANPLDLSTGIPADAIVGPVPSSPEDSPAGDPLAYAAADPPENPLDLSTGIPNDAIVGPIPADAAPDEPEPLTYPATDPPPNPLDLSAGIPNDAIVGPLTAEAEPAAEPAGTLAYAGTNPPANPLDLSTGIPADEIVGPLTAEPDTTAEPAGTLAYAATNPPANPLDLSAGIPGDAVVGPLTPEPEAAEPVAHAPNPLDLSTQLPTDVTGARPAVPGSPAVNLAGIANQPAPAEAVGDPGADAAVATAGPHVAVTAPPIDPHDLAALRAAADAVDAAAPGAAADTTAGEVTATGGGPHDGGHVIEPVAYTTSDRPARPALLPTHDRRRRLVGLAAAVLLAAAVIVPLVHRNTTPGTPVAAEHLTPAERATPSTETTTPTCAGSEHLAGSGSAFQSVAIATVAQQWGVRCPGSNLDYIPGGTTFGLQQFATGEADLAVTDHVLGANEGEIAAVAARCAGVGAPANKNLVVQVPMVLTPVVLAYNLPGIGELRLDPPAVAAILSGRIVRWNDRALTDLNPGTRLPATAITVVARSDEAQTTQTVQQYLTAVGGWRSGEGPEFTGKATNRQTSDVDVFAAVRGIPGAIGYLAYPIISPTQEPVVSLVVGDSKATPPDTDAVDAAADSALRGIDDYTLLPGAIFHAVIDEAGDGTVPYALVHVGYVVACAEYPDDRTTAAVRDFLLTALGMQVPSASGYQLPFSDLRLRLIDLVQRTY